MKDVHQTLLHAALTGAVALAATATALGCDRAYPSSQRAASGVRERAQAFAAVVGRSAARDDALLILIDVAENDTGVEKFDASRFERLVAASASVLGERLRPRSPAECVAETLARAGDPRATAALVAWVSRPTTSVLSRRRALHAMEARPVPAYLGAVRALLAQPERATEVMPLGLEGALGAVFGRRTLASSQVKALTLARAIGDEASLDLLRRSSLDRSLPSPDPRALQALRCPKGGGWRGGQSREKAEALASLRIVALGLLGERSLFDAVARDPEEAPLVRRSAAAMFKAPALPPLTRVIPARGLGLDLVGVAHLGPSDDDGNLETDCP